MEQKEYWNQVSQEKTFTTPFQADIFESYADKALSVLDVGCGYGRILEELYQKGYRNLIGIDFSDGMITRGKALYPYLNLRTQTSAHIDLPDQSVGAVILFAVLTCISNDEEQKQLLQEIFRVLQPGGILYVNDFLLNTDKRNLDRYQLYHQEHGGVYGIFQLPEGAVLRHHDETWIQQLLSSFSQKEYGHLTFSTMNGHQSNGFYYIGEKPTA